MQLPYFRLYIWCNNAVLHWEQCLIFHLKAFYLRFLYSFHFMCQLSKIYEWTVHKVLWLVCNTNQAMAESHSMPVDLAASTGFLTQICTSLLDLFGFCMCDLSVKFLVHTIPANGCYTCPRVHIMQSWAQAFWKCGRTPWC